MLAICRNISLIALSLVFFLFLLGTPLSSVSAALFSIWRALCFSRNLRQFTVAVLPKRFRQIAHSKSASLYMTFFGYHYCTTSFNKAWTQVLCAFKSCSRRVGDSLWWRSLTMVPAGNKAKRLLSVNHTTKTIHYRHHYLHDETCQYTFVFSVLDFWVN